MKRVLSIDGGGVHGLLPCAILCEIESRIKAPVGSVFDLVAGTSIGGILACLIGSGRSALEAEPFFTEDAPKIFGHTRLFGWGGILRPRYSSSPIESVLQARLSGHPFDFDTPSPRVIVTAYDVQNDEDIIFESWAGTGAYAWEVARATSAAQTYFPAFTWHDRRAGVNRVLWDGGIVANNPAGIAVARAAALWPGEELAVLSLGCGATRNFCDGRKVANASLMRAGSKTMSTLFETNDEVPHLLLNQLLKRYMRIQPPAVGTSMDDVSREAMELLQARARQSVIDNSDRIDAFLNMAHASAINASGAKGTK